MSACAGSSYDEPVELVERELFLTALADHLAEASAGSGRLVLVGGEAGVGKTSLVRAFAAGQDGGTRILWSACDGLFTPQPLAPLVDLAADLGLSLDLPRGELFSATLEALRPRPTLVVVEDVHWADEATLDLLRFLGRRLEQTAALLVATYRDDEVGLRHPLRVVLGDVPGERRIALPPLSPEGVRTLARGSGLDPKALHRLTGGNPFFVTEVLAGGGDGVPESVRDAVLARARQLGEAARRVLDAAAVVGARVELSLLREAMDEPLSALEECLEAGMLQAQGDDVAFTHELARRAVEPAIDPLRRAELHGRVLAALGARSRRDHARLAHHAEAAGDAVAVLEYAPAAAENAAALGAHREAAVQFARALRFADGLPPRDVGELLERRAYECYLTDQVEEALAAQRAALELYVALGDGLKQGDMLRRIARLSYLDARIDDARQAAREAVTVLERFPPGKELVLAYAGMAQMTQIDLDLDAAVAWGERAHALARELGAEELAINALTSLGIADAIAGRGTGRLEQTLELALRSGGDDSLGRVYGALSFAAVRRRDWTAADRWLERGLRFTAERDLDSWRLYLLGWRAGAFLDRGRWDEAAADAEAVLRHPFARLSRVWALMVLGLLRARRGDPELWVPLAEAVQLTHGESPQKRIPLQITCAEAAYLAGDTARAVEELGTFPVAAMVDRWMAGKLAVWRRRAGVQAEGTGPLPEPFELELAGDHAGAAAAWDALGCPYDAALALSGSEEEDDLRRSHERLLALGARPSAAIVARRLRDKGARGVVRGPRPATRAHPAGLTPREQAVLDLLTDGLTNAEIAARLVISEKTVGHHVSAILGKLGVRSRYEAARLAAEDRELVPPR
jgi:DNA-binding CsgD family transcriptional regulator/tetratricopeptide (TPR) repeat protein